MPPFKCLISLMLILVVSASCNDTGSIRERRWKQAKTATGPILIGAAAPWKRMAGKTDYRSGLEFAVAEVNARGGVLGRPVKLVFRDDQASVDQGRKIAQEFAENTDMVAVIGHFDSAVSLSAAIMYQYYGMLMLSPASTTPELTDHPGYDLIFRNIPPDTALAARLAEFCAEEGYRRMMIYSGSGKWGTGLANAFEYRADELGINVVEYRSFDFSSDTHFFETDIARWQTLFQFDAIFLAASVTQAVEFVTAARNLGLIQPIVKGDALDSDQNWQAAKEAARGLVVGTYFHPGMPGEKVKKFVADFRKKYGHVPDTWAAQSYDALGVLCAAMEKAGTTEPPRVADALRSLEPWEGVTGIHKFDASGDGADNVIVMEEFKDGRFVFLEEQ